MRVQSLVVVDGHLSMMSFTVVHLDSEILVYERNGFALRFRPSQHALTQRQLLDQIKELNGGMPDLWCSGTHISFYWLIVHAQEALPNLVTVQSILECFQRGGEPDLSMLSTIQVEDDMVHLDVGTACVRIEHWRVEDQEYWMFVCRAGGQALVCNGERLYKLWLEPYGEINSVLGMREWLSPTGMQASSEELTFLWLQSYGREFRSNAKPDSVSRVPYRCFPNQDYELRCQHFTLNQLPELV